MSSASTPYGARVATQLSADNIKTLLSEVARHVSASAYLYLPHPGSATAFAAAPQSAPTFIEAIIDFPIEEFSNTRVVSPQVAWQVDENNGAHPAVEMICAEFRYAIGQVDARSAELGDDEFQQLLAAREAESDLAPTAGFGAGRRYEPRTHNYAGAEPSAPSGSAPAAPRPVMSAPPVPPAAPAAPAPARPAVADPPGVVRAPAFSDQPAAQVASVQLALVLDGRSHVLAPRTLVGRAPQMSAEYADARVVALNDPERSISKTHALLEYNGSSLWVTDLGSTNGTFLATDAGEQPCRPGQRTEVRPGTQLSLGTLRVSFGTVS